MSKRHGINAVIQLEDSGGTLRTISNDVDNTDAPINIDSGDVIGFGDASHSYVVGAQDSPISLKGPYNDLVTTGIHAVLTSIIRGTGVGGSAGYDFRYMPSGTASGMPRLRGRVLLTSYQPTSPVSGPVTWQASLMPALSTGLNWETI